MVRVDRWIFGYIKIKIDIENISLASSILIREKISSHIKPNGEIIISFVSGQASLISSISIV